MRLGILTDIHHVPAGNPPAGWHNPHQFETVRERLAKSIRWLEAERADRIAVLGDLTHHGDEPSLREVIEIVARANVPVWVLRGNHDLNPDRAAFTGAIETSGGGTVTALDPRPVPLDGVWQVMGLPIERATGGFMASPLPEPGTWVDRPMLVLSHFPVLSLQRECAGAGLKYAGDLVNVGEMAGSLIERTAPTFVINGHLHVRHAASRGSVLQAACGAQVESLFEATLVNFGNWSRGRITWTSTPIRDVWPGVAPALSDANQA